MSKATNRTEQIYSPELDGAVDRKTSSTETFRQQRQDGRQGELQRYLPMDIIERIKSQLTASPVVLYMKGTPDFPQCGFSAAAVRALGAVGANFQHVNIFEDPELREALKQYSNWPTYPQLYINGELIGGADIIMEMYKSGELQTLVEGAK
jgi:monothiol glutaredoxin